jgi:hypothetical protein
MALATRTTIGGPIDTVLGAPAGFLEGKANEITGKLDGVEKLLWIATGASVITATWVLLFLKTSK